MRIALLGYGTVGRAVRRIAEQPGSGLEVAVILRRPGKCDEPCMTDSIDAVLADKSIDAVVEVMGGIEPARTYIMSALEEGKHVVTANKAVVAAHVEEFAAKAAEKGVGLFIEACVGGGIPWLVNLARVARIDEVSAFSGILNGTSNYIIDRMAREGADFADVLADAQAAGLAEADPSADIDGYDIRNKAIISACVAFGVRCRTDVPVLGIRTLSKEVMDAAAALGYTVKLMAQGRCEGGSYVVAVAPALVPAGCVEAAVPGNFNIASLTGGTIGELKFYGQGAGGDPTGNAVVQDVLDCAEGRLPSYPLDRELMWGAGLLRSDAVVFTASTSALPADAVPFCEGAWRIPARTPEEVVDVARAALAADAAAFTALLVPAGAA